MPYKQHVEVDLSFIPEASAEPSAPPLYSEQFFDNAGPAPVYERIPGAIKLANDGFYSEKNSKSPYIDHKILNFLKFQGLYNDPSSYHETAMMVFLDVSAYKPLDAIAEEKFKYEIALMIYKLSILADHMGKDKILKLFPFGVACGEPIVFDVNGLSSLNGTHTEALSLIRMQVDMAFANNNVINGGNFYVKPMQKIAEHFHETASYEKYQRSWWEQFINFLGFNFENKIEIFGRIFHKKAIKKAVPANVYVLTSTEQNQGQQAEHISELHKAIRAVSHLPAFCTLVPLRNSERDSDSEVLTQTQRVTFLQKIRRYLLRSSVVGDGNKNIQLAEKRQFNNLNIFDAENIPPEEATVESLVGNYPLAMLQARKSGVLAQKSTTYGINWEAVQEVMDQKLAERRNRLACKASHAASTLVKPNRRATERPVCHFKASPQLIESLEESQLPLGLLQKFSHVSTMRDAQRLF